jgi:hypothetical protein
MLQMVLIPFLVQFLPQVAVGLKTLLRPSLAVLVVALLVVAQVAHNILVQVELLVRVMLAAMVLLF